MVLDNTTSYSHATVQSTLMIPLNINSFSHKPHPSTFALLNYPLALNGAYFNMHFFLILIILSWAQSDTMYTISSFYMLGWNPNRLFPAVALYCGIMGCCCIST